MIGKLVLFGATGDLAGRYLLPALASLHAARRLPHGFEVVGAATEDWDDETFRRHALQRLEQHAGEISVAARKALVTTLSYRQVDLGDPASVARAIHGDTDTGRAAAVYLALPPALYPVAVTSLGSAGLPIGSRIVVEKPYGEDLASTLALNALLSEVCESLGEDGAFRVDHVLGMATAQNLLGLRFANRILEPVWNSVYIEQIDILWEETLALEGRASFYDRSGALKDVIQNHMLQILCLIAMEPPASLEGRDVHAARLELLRSVRPPAPDEMTSRTRRARYTAGRIGDRAVPAYVEEPGVDPGRGTETFAELVLDIETPRWAGSRFVMRAGKALSRMRREVVVRFRRVRQPPFGDDSGLGGTSILRIGIDGPEDMVLHLVGSSFEPSPSLVPVTLAGPPPPSDLPAYGNVLLDILGGGNSLSVRADEAEQEWRIVMPVLEAWDAGEVPLQEYPAGSIGPPPLEVPV